MGRYHSASTGPSLIVEIIKFKLTKNLKLKKVEKRSA
jgi:hypothetical protein